VDYFVSDSPLGLCIDLPEKRPSCYRVDCGNVLGVCTPVNLPDSLPITEVGTSRLRTYREVRASRQAGFFREAPRLWHSRHYYGAREK